MEPNQELFVGQHIKIKTSHAPYSSFNRKWGTVVGFEEEGITLVRPDANLNKCLKLYSQEIRDTDPPQQAPPEIRELIPELA